MMEFFLPEVPADEVETTYARLASWCGAETPPADRRIYSVEFQHDGTDYVATVGEPTRGEIYTTNRGGRRDDSRPPQRVVRGNPVLAIFKSDPYFMFQVASERPSYWANPAMIGRPTKVVYFDPPGTPA